MPACIFGPTHPHPALAKPARTLRNARTTRSHHARSPARSHTRAPLPGVYCCGYDVSLNARNGFPVFSTHIEANHVAKGDAGWGAGSRLTDEDRQRISSLALDPRIGEARMRQRARHHSGSTCICAGCKQYMH